jgi:hypothetical protein
VVRRTGQAATVDVIMAATGQMAESTAGTDGQADACELELGGIG